MSEFSIASLKYMNWFVVVVVFNYDGITVEE